MTVKTRDYSLDLLKIIAICMVCSYHFTLFRCGFAHINSFTFETFLSTILFMANAICIPLFFMVNGALLLSRPVNVKKHIIKSVILIVGHIIFRFLTILIIALYKNFDFASVGIKEWVNATLFLGSFPGIDLVHMWFIPMLLSLYIIYPLIQEFFFKNKNNLYLIFFIVFALAIMVINGDFVILQKCIFRKSYTINGLNQLNPFGTSRLGYIFYFVLGGLIYKYKDKLKNIKWYYLTIAYIVGLAILFMYWHFQYAMWDYIFGAYNLMPTVIMAGSIFLLCLKLPNEKIEKCKFLAVPIKAIGSNTLIIYYTHWIFGYTLLQSLIPHISYGILSQFLKVIIFVVVGTLIGSLMKKIPIVKYLSQ